jgi:hypothetical protein
MKTEIKASTWKLLKISSSNKKKLYGPPIPGYAIASERVRTQILEEKFVYLC